MQTRQLGRSALAVTPVCLGTMTFGEQTSEADANAQLDLARERGLTPTQLALGFVRSRWFVASTIVGASSLAQLRENLDALDAALDSETLAAVDRLHLTHTNPAP